MGPYHTKKPVSLRVISHFCLYFYYVVVRTSDNQLDGETASRSSRNSCSTTSQLTERTPSPRNLLQSKALHFLGEDSLLLTCPHVKHDNYDFRQSISLMLTIKSICYTTRCTIYYYVSRFISGSTRIAYENTFSFQQQHC